MDVVNYTLSCNKCGRKILVEIVLFGVNHNASVRATCAECLTLNEEYCAEHSEECEEIKEWKNE